MADRDLVAALEKGDAEAAKELRVRYAGEFYWSTRIFLEKAGFTVRHEFVEKVVDDTFKNIYGACEQRQRNLRQDIHVWVHAICERTAKNAVLEAARLASMIAWEVKGPEGSPYAVPVTDAFERARKLVPEFGETGRGGPPIGDDHHMLEHIFLEHVHAALATRMHK